MKTTKSPFDGILKFFQDMPHWPHYRQYSLLAIIVGVFFILASFLL